MTTKPGTTAVALMMMTLLAAGPALSQTAGPAAAAAPMTDSTRRALATGAPAARPLTNAALALAGRTNASQDAAPATPPDPGVRSAKECGSFVVLGTAIGAGAGAGAGFLLLASSGGSDSYAAILKGFSVIGAVLGSVGGLIACAD